jgi:hypothetical protein
MKGNELNYSTKKDWIYPLALLEERVTKLEQVQLPETHNPIHPEMDLKPIRTYHSPMDIRRQLEEADRNRHLDRGSIE